MFNFFIEFLLKNNKIKWLLFLIRKTPDFFKNHPDLNLWHLACKYQIKDLLFFANEYKHNINSFTELRILF